MATPDSVAVGFIKNGNRRLLGQPLPTLYEWETNFESPWPNVRLKVNVVDTELVSKVQDRL